ncbi:antibiotic biosynthesis monooxygenase [Phenylobacterium sp.]|uniref:antibiotic biosynthesis monooxygenase family protein n=1 Tax=Phenylobacterium sp. TaxID=1871053 RepID=UPI0012267B13|nr:antibiotic biosynthesis monooxygenase [Phenylobacterium sp.]THD60104.1 MAG: antibiotic biosynthesis monooxygenase [Phenylobacterium sp.]
MIAATPAPPYFAVIFTSTRTEGDHGYAEMAGQMEELASTRDGFLGIESARADNIGLTISYWRDEHAISAWKADVEHLAAQRLGRERWYDTYSVRVAKVERAYDFVSANSV